MLNQAQFLSKIKTDSIVILQESLLLDAQTPISLANEFLNQKDFCFLEGVEQGSHYYSLSYLAFNPFVKLQAIDQITTKIKHANHPSSTLNKNIYTCLEELIQKYQLNDQKNPFSAGILGFLSYECVQFLEHIPFPKKQELNLPLARLMIPKTMIIFNNKNNIATVNQIIFKDQWKKTDPKILYEQEKKALNQTLKTIIKPSRPLEILPLDSITAKKNLTENVHFNLNKAQYIQMVKTCKEYIKKGHIFQIQISRRAKTTLQTDPFNIYRLLRNTNPSPFMFYIQFDDHCMIGSSPEILVGVKNNQVNIRPLAGTRKRYSSKKTETQIIEELLNDEKERAEHVMLVDLARNDVGRSCAEGSVKVTELMGIEKYQHVIHIVSDVIGTLKPECSALDAFKYSFPAGTVSGAPKVRAMEIISELEITQREFYSGGVVFFDFSGNLKSTLVIRSILIKNQNIYTQAAAGIVADSDPELEFLETENKMKSCLQAMLFKS